MTDTELIELVKADADHKPDPKIESVLAGTRLLPRQIARVIIDAGWSRFDRVTTMIAVVFAESAGYTEAVGGPNGDGSHDLGLLQLNTNHAPALHMTDAQFEQMAFVPEQAVGVARALYVFGSPTGDAGTAYSFDPWAAYTNGSYKTFLPVALIGAANAYAEGAGFAPIPFVTRRS